MLKLIHISGNVLMVNSCCYGRRYVKKLISLCTFLKSHTHLEENLARSFQNVCDKCSRVLNLVFSRNWIFHENHHILGYHTTLKLSAQWPGLRMAVRLEMSLFWYILGDPGAVSGDEKKSKRAWKKFGRRKSSPNFFSEDGFDTNLTIFVLQIKLFLC